MFILSNSQELIAFLSLNLQFTIYIILLFNDIFNINKLSWFCKFVLFFSIYLILLVNFITLSLFINILINIDFICLSHILNS